MRGGGGGPRKAPHVHIRWGGKQGADGGDGGVDEEVVRLGEGLRGVLLLLRAWRRVLEETEEEATVEGCRRRGLKLSVGRGG